MVNNFNDEIKIMTYFSTVFDTLLKIGLKLHISQEAMQYFFNPKERAANVLKAR